MRKTVSTPNEAIALLLKRFDNNRNLHRMTNDQARQIADIVARLDSKQTEVRTYLPILRAVADVWFMKYLFPNYKKEVLALEALMRPTFAEINEEIEYAGREIALHLVEGKIPTLPQRVKSA